MQRPGELHTDLEGFCNYDGVEQDEDVREKMQEYTDAGYLRELNSIEDLKVLAGGGPSSAGLIALSREV